MHKFDCVAMFLSGHRHRETYVRDDHGIHHVSLAAALEAPPDQVKVLELSIDTVGHLLLQRSCQQRGGRDMYDIETEIRMGRTMAHRVLRVRSSPIERNRMWNPATVCKKGRGGEFKRTKSILLTCSTSSHSPLRRRLSQASTCIRTALSYAGTGLWRAEPWPLEPWRNCPKIFSCFRRR